MPVYQPPSGNSGSMNTSTYDPAAIAQQVVGVTATQTLTNKNLTSGTNTFPTLNQNTTGTAAGITGKTTPTGALIGDSDTQTLTNKRVNPRINSTSSSATPAINVDTTDQFNITAQAAAITSVTSGLTGSPVDGQKLMIRIKDNGSAQTITWGASFASSGTATLLATTVASKTHHVGFIYDTVTAKWICLASDSMGY